MSWSNLVSLDPEVLLGALKAGEFYSSQGPRIHDIELTRKVVRVQCSPVNTIAVVTGASAALSRVGLGLTDVTIEYEEAKKWAWRDLPPVKWFRIVVIDGPRRALDQPDLGRRFELTWSGRTDSKPCRTALAITLARRGAGPYMRRLPNG